MLIFQHSRIEGSIERPVAAGASITAEGAALVADYTSGVFGVKMSTGAAGEKFVGVSVARVIPATQAAKIETLTVAANTVTLAKTPVNGTIRVVPAGGAAYTVQAGAPAAAGQVQNVNGSKTLTFNTGTENAKVVTVTYLYNLSAVEAVALQGNAEAGGTAAAYLGQIGCITKGDVYTDQFDTLVDWSSPANCTLGANGKFTIGGTGVAVPGYVISAPADGAAYLGLHINAD
jgi:hypothetical protein